MHPFGCEWDVDTFHADALIFPISTLHHTQDADGIFDAMLRNIIFFCNTRKGYNSNYNTVHYQSGAIIHDWGIGAPHHAKLISFMYIYNNKTEC